MGDFFNLTMEVKTLVEEHGRFCAFLNDIRRHGDTDSRCDELELDFEVIGLPQHQLIPVRNIEPITIYPSNAKTLPVVTVRDDSPVVPHLNIHEDNVQKSLLPMENKKGLDIPPYIISFRVDRFKLSDSSFEPVLTNLDFLPDKLKHLYAMRWGIETSLRELKYIMGLSHFHAKRPDFLL